MMCSSISSKCDYKRFRNLRQRSAVLYYLCFTEGHFLPREKQCIGVTGKNAVSTTMVCNKNDLAVKWIWTAYDQMLNLKTLTCLIPKTRRKFSMRKCNVNVNSQKWACQIPYINVSNRGRPTFKQRWIKPEDGSYFQNCSQNLFSYKGKRN